MKCSSPGNNDLGIYLGSDSNKMLEKTEKMHKLYIIDMVTLENLLVNEQKICF